MSEPTAQPDYPPAVEEAFERVGPPAEEFAGSPTTAGVAIFLGALGLLAGVAGTVFVIYYIIDRGFNVKALRALAIPVVGVLGWFGLRNGLRNRFVRIYICERGLVHRTAAAVAVYPWADIEEVVQDRVKDGLDENGAPFMKRGTTFLIKRRDGAQLGIDENVLKKPLTFARRLYHVTRPHGIPWNLYQG